MASPQKPPPPPPSCGSCCDAAISLAHLARFCSGRPFSRRSRPPVPGAAHELCRGQSSALSLRDRRAPADRRGHQMSFAAALHAPSRPHVGRTRASDLRHRLVGPLFVALDALLLVRVDVVLCLFKEQIHGRLGLLCRRQLTRASLSLSEPRSDAQGQLGGVQGLE